MVSSEYIDSVNQHPRENTVEPIGNEQVDGRQSYNGLEVLDDVGTKLHWRQIRLLMISSTGFFMDAWGRKKIYGIELIIITIATIFCATSASAEAGLSAIAFLGFWRLILGIGIGGDYPLSATITSEWASSKRRGQMIAAVFSMQGFGNVAAALVTLIVLACFKVPVQNNVVNLDYVWRICVGLGAVPAAATVYFRLTLPESPRYSVDVIGDKEAAQKALEINKWVPADDKEASLHHRDSLVPPNSEKGEQNIEHISEVTNQNGTDIDEAKHSKRDFRAYFSKWTNLKVLLGTSLAWFLMDIAFYGTNLNQSIILSQIGFAPKGLDPWDTLFKQALGNLILSVLGALPGYIVTVFTVEILGRKPIQYMGFFIVGVLFIILGAAWNPIHTVNVALFIVLFAIIQFFFNFGPNSTTFISPAEVFPTRHRSKAHGIAAASGKAGAIIATFGFNALADVGGPPGAQTFLPDVLIIFGVIMLIGMIPTMWVPESKGKSLAYFEKERLKPERDLWAIFKRKERTEQI
ncbi:unnamed protein product [Umbelopsis sp. WA50703]